jgi:ferredoxin
VACGTCEPVCPVEAIFYDEDVPLDRQDYTRANVEFFDALGSPGGGAKLELIERDHPLIAALQSYVR